MKVPFVQLLRLKTLDYWNSLLSTYLCPCPLCYSYRLSIPYPAATSQKILLLCSKLSIAFLSQSVSGSPFYNGHKTPYHLTSSPVTRLFIHPALDLLLSRQLLERAKNTSPSRSLSLFLLPQILFPLMPVWLASHLFQVSTQISSLPGGPPLTTIYGIATILFTMALPSFFSKVLMTIGVLCIYLLAYCPFSS